MTDPTRLVVLAPHEEPRLLDGRHGTESVPAPALVLDLVELPADRVRGIYTIGGVPGRMPQRALYLHPDVAHGFIAAAHQLVVSDIFRSPESSLAAVRSGRGARPPGFSAHNFGLAIDLDIKASMRRANFKTKEILDLAMEQQGFCCHRLDHKITDLKGESHHYNALVDEYATILASATSTAAAIEVRILALYGHTWRSVDAKVAQAQLARLGLYRGDLDGKLGPISRAAVRVFRRGWGLGDSDRLDARTFRTLVYVAAGRRVTPAVG